MTEYSFTYGFDDLEILPETEDGFRMSASATGEAEIAYEFCPTYGDLDQWSIGAITVEGWKGGATQQFDLPDDHPLHAMISVAMARESVRAGIVEALQEHIEREHGPFRNVEADLAADYRASAL